MPDKNMKKIIFGITDLADVLFYELMAAGENIDAFCVNRQYITDTMHLGRKVVAYEDINDIYDVHELGCYIAVGYNSMNDARKKIYHELKGNGDKSAFVCAFFGSSHGRKSGRRVPYI